MKNSFRNSRILVIEDNPDHWFFIEKAMELCLSEVSATHITTEQASIDYMNSCLHQEWDLPTLILLDLYLPNPENGWRVLEHIKQMPAPVNQIPIVMLSSSNQRDDIAEAYHKGISSYLVKPTQLEEWISYFQKLRSYWWETATLPKMKFSL
ncbi:response regulator [Fibrisoma montanum]|uniref:Response regulator n=1 Tax=Fibrisoma montanum TaxID=2305895 RepID=A0A418M4K2_9BACT|nr:response regulator [Fibrisoma montanum]RIV20747.1 response regulator [Fibrisoma montanum]